MDYFCLYPPEPTISHSQISLIVIRTTFIFIHVSWYTFISQFIRFLVLVLEAGTLPSTQRKERLKKAKREERRELLCLWKVVVVVGVEPNPARDYMVFFSCFCSLVEAICVYRNKLPKKYVLNQGLMYIVQTISVFKKLYIWTPTILIIL
jgi:hypothetical protein